jgi:hypothetical protein
MFASSSLTITNNNMTTAQRIPFANFRDAILEMYEVGESINVFGYSLRLCISLRENTITNEQFEGISQQLKWYCEKFNIETSNEIASLF